MQKYVFFLLPRIFSAVRHNIFGIFALFIKIEDMGNESSFRLNDRYKVRDVQGEHIILKAGNVNSTVVGFNETSNYLWHKLQGREFSLDDVVRLLTDEFDVDADTARADAAKWLDDMRAQDFLA